VSNDISDEGDDGNDDNDGDDDDANDDDKQEGDDTNDDDEETDRNKDADVIDVDQGEANQQNASQQFGFQQEEEDAHVSLTYVLETQKTGCPTQSSSISSDFTSKLLNLDNPSPTDTMIASLID
nr:hypothetical protein [Tanacetum cinerariifolium]